MIVFDLACAQGHVFEAWFGSQEDYEDQRERGLVTCVICNDGAVAKAPMAPRIASRGGGEIVDAKAMMARMMVAQQRLLEKSEDVGSRFASEARAIHDGEADNRLIHGQATVEEAKSLVDDGVPVAPLPFPVRAPGRDN
ncbi:MAG TPA: DUF1178 family protein [Sphingomonas sp.]